jgi:hypothetical protein
VDNSIKLKKLQVISGALRKGDEGLGTFILFFQKGFFLVRKGGWGKTPFGKRQIFLGMGTNPKVCF